MILSQLIKKGWLSTTNVGLTKGLSREYWFVLYTDALAWFKDESVSIVKSLFTSFVSLTLKNSSIFTGTVTKITDQGNHCINGSELVT